MKSKGSLVYNVSLVVGDFLALLAAFSGGYILRVSVSHRPISQSIHAITYLEIFLVLLPFWILLFALMGLYDSSIHEKRFTEAGRLLVGSFIGLLFVAAIAYFDKRPVFPAKLVPVYGFILAFFFLLLFRNLARYVRSKLFTYDIGITNLLLIGDTKIARELTRDFEDPHQSGYHIVGVVADKTKIAKRFPHLPVFETFEEAVTKLHPQDLHGIVQTELYANQHSNNAILEFAQTHHISYRFIPGNTELFVGNIEVELFRSSVPVIAVHQTPLIGWGRIVKRLTDVTLGGLFLIISLPFMLLIAVMEKISDPSAPVLYKENRLTRFGNQIRIYKFRSLKRAYSGLSPEQGFTKMGRPELIRVYRDSGDQLPNDPRISHLGRFLRASSLDELPQLFNVVKGNISLVGPRALYPPELAKYERKDMLLAVKSGLTGLAQVSGRRDISFEERRKLDLYYVQNWSLWSDLVILAKTVRVVLRRIGAR